MTGLVNGGRTGTRPESASAPHIVLISAVYHPEPVVSARMTLDLARCLVQSGIRVTVLCPFPSRPSVGAYTEHASRKTPAATVEEGIEVVRLPSFSAPLSRLLPRLYESWSFGRHACSYLAALPAGTPAAIYANVWPLFAQAQVAAFARRRRIPLVLQVMDVYPESLLNRLPAPARRLIGRPLRVVDLFAARRADRLCVISESMKALYVEERGIPAKAITTIPTWQDEAPFASLPERGLACRHYGIPGGVFTFLYLGNIGQVAGVDVTIRAFHLAGLADAQLVIAGDGTGKASCAQLARELGGAVHFISDPEVGNVPLLQSLADVCLLPLRRGAGSSSIPSKLSAYLLSAKPVLASLDDDCDTARMIRHSGCGWVVPAEDAVELAVRMREVTALHPAKLSALGGRGREYALAHLGKTQGVRRLSELVTSCLQR